MCSQHACPMGSTSLQTLPGRGLQVRRTIGRRLPLFLLANLLLCGAVLRAQQPAQTQTAQYTTESIRGRIVWMAEALQRRYGIQSVPEAAERVLALETAQGRLYPLVEDIRGRSFRVDPRLRKLADTELLVRRHEGSPAVQVIRIYSHDKSGKFELDYWCEICAIAMFELKVCDCCQGPTELRRRQVPQDP